MSRSLRRVWIVDDSPLDLERARGVLHSHYDVRTFQDGSVVLECLTEQAPPDVLVLDWVMPGISGVDVCRFLRAQNGRDGQMGILLLTGHRAVEQIVEGLEAGANDYLSKPYENEELLARVASQMRARELLERALLAEDENRRLLESAPDAMLALDASGEITFVNPEAARVLGMPRESIVGRSIAQFIPTLPQPSTWTARELFDLLEDVEIAGGVYSPTLRVPAKGRKAPSMLSLRDVTARRQAEARRLDLYSIIAHDLRSPLHAMALRTQLIAKGRHGPLPDGLLQDMHKIDASIHSLVAMINDFLEMARAEASPLRLERTSVDLAALLDEAMEVAGPLRESRQIDWRRNVPAALEECRVLGDAKRLSQVFGNLLVNAIKFTPPSGLITTTIECLGEAVQVVVEDTGKGVAAHSLPTLFQRYTRAAEGAVAGTGLGLMIVREIVEAHGGTVGVESEEGRGSRFWMRLPRPQAL